MADIQGTSVHYFIYMCIVQASSVSRPPYNIHGPPGFHGFISKRNELFCNTCWQIYHGVSGLPFAWILRHFSGDICYLLTFPWSFSEMFFLRNQQNMICIFGGWPPNYLIPPEAFWTSMLHCFWPAVQFLLKDQLDRDGEMFVVLLFDICNVYDIVAHDYLYSEYWGRV